jgi:hypothetical protein
MAVRTVVALDPPTATIAVNRSLDHEKSRPVRPLDDDDLPGSYVTARGSSAQQQVAPAQRRHHRPTFHPSEVERDDRAAFRHRCRLSGAARGGQG